MTSVALLFCDHCGAKLNIFGKCAMIEHSEVQARRELAHAWLRDRLSTHRGYDAMRQLHHQSGYVLGDIYDELRADHATEVRADALALLREVFEDGA